MKIFALAFLAAGLAFAQTPAKDTKKPVAPKAEPAKPAAPAAKPAEPAKPAEAKKPVAGGLVGNKDSKTLHKAECKTAAQMKEANKVTFASREEAEKQGYKACKVCLK